MNGTSKSVRWLAVALMAWWVSAPVSAVGQGWIEPGVDRGGFAVDKVRSDVRVRIEGRVAIVEVSEWFENRGARLAEGDYLYPLAGEAVFQGFSLFQGETELRGEIMDADRARAIYEAIVRRRADPALIELAGQGLLRARVFPIQPGETRKVSLRYTQVLERAGDALQLAYVGAVRGQDRRGLTGISQTMRDTAPTDFEVVIDDCEQFLDPFSPTHGLEVERHGARMTVRVRDAVEGRLAIFFPLVGEAVGLSMATHRPVGEDGYFMLTLTPDEADRNVEPRDVTVVVDVSGSMSGEKIDQARAALRQLLGSLAEHDRFRLISFSNAVRMQSEGWVSPDEQGLAEALSWVGRLAADGGTNIEAALQEAFRLSSPLGRLPVVLFLTDGLPSVGEQSPERLAGLAERSAGRARVFAFGVGFDVNTQLLDRLGEAGRGDTDYVLPGENVERALSLLATKIQHPVLTDVELSARGFDVSEIYPVRIPDVFAGEELVLFGRFRGVGDGRISVEGRRSGGIEEFGTNVELSAAQDANDFIPRLWASRKLGHLERQVWTEGMSESLVDEIRAVALRYGLPSRYTSYLVQEPDVVAWQPMDPRGGGTGSSGSVARMQSAAPAVATGASAVKAAADARTMRSLASSAELEAAEDRMLSELLDQGASPRKALAGRLFELRDGVWTDLGMDEAAAELRVAPYSRAWFDLIGALPEVEPILRDMESVVIGGVDLTVYVEVEGVERLEPREVARIVAAFRGQG